MTRTPSAAHARAVAIVLGDVIDVLGSMPDASADALFCDPPYGLRFMGKRWDYDVPGVDVWTECLRVLKPGAPLLAFGGSRTFHRMTVAIEDAGFEIRDVLMYMYGTGFPKSQDVGMAIDKAAGATREVVGSRVLPGFAKGRGNGKDEDGRPVYLGINGPKQGDVDAPVTVPATDLARTWDGYGTALKPAYEPIILARKPLDRTMAQNVDRWGVGGLAIDACRIGTESRVNPAAANKGGGASYNLSAVGMPSDAAAKACVGRWPANVLMDEEAAAHLDAVVGDRRSALTGRADPTAKHAHPADADSTRSSMFGNEHARGAVYADAGGPSRFFYTAKVSTKERNAGTDGNTHPTLKPLALTRYLAALIKPPHGGRIVVPFAGAGSEVIGAVHAGWSEVIGIEREAEYAEIASARIAHWCGEVSP